LEKRRSRRFAGEILIVLESEILRYAQDDKPLASACTKCVVSVESWVGVESKPRDLGSDRGYRVAER
jgi:hypothetical protein